MSTQVRNAIRAELEVNAQYDRKMKHALGVMKATPSLWQKAAVLLSTTRNKLLVTNRQQDMLSRAVVGFFGLSVGSHAATTWMMLSRARRIKIADPDTIDPSNLNRIRAGWSSVGQKKVRLVRIQLEDMNPSARIYISEIGTPSAMEQFCTASPRVSIIVDEIDDLAGKIKLRQVARAMRIPLISAVDVGDNVLLDVERYDKAPMPQLFLGQLKGVETWDVGAMSPQEKIRAIVTLVGLKHNEQAMLTSLLAVGRTIKTWPQLGSTATIAGGVVATTIKRILLNEDVSSGRYYVDMDEIFHAQKSRSDTAAIARRIFAVKKRLGL